jgi:hypothetical protein|tara:strand:- start:4882 stop:6087 length:1206 start_codon:yes stop_codon:yes gene_type:complete
MAETQQFSRTESLPPEFLRQFFAGVPGANVPGVLPLLNQELVNRILGMGVEGATPFTYTGQRIADFTPAEREAFRLTGESAGAYMPFINRATDLSEQSLQDVRGTTGLGLDFLRSAGAEGAGATREALGILRGLPSQFQTAQGIGLGGLGAFNPNMAQGFYNPFEEQVVGQTLDDITKRFSQADIANRARQVASGAFGGSRGRLSSEELAESFGRGATDAVANIRSRGFSQAQNQAQNAFEQAQRRALQTSQLFGNLAGQQGNVAGGIGSLGSGLSNILGGVGRDISTVGLRGGQFGANIGQQIAGLGGGLSGLVGTDINRLLGVGGMQRGLDQQGLDLDYQNFVGQYNLPLQTFGQIGQLAAGFAPALGGTNLTSATTDRPSNSLMQGIGTAIAAYGALT